MKIKDVNDQIENINLAKKTKTAIFTLIDYKVENDMDKVISEMRNGFKTVYWVIGIAFALFSLITTAITIWLNYKQG